MEDQRPRPRAVPDPETAPAAAPDAEAAPAAPAAPIEFEKPPQPRFEGEGADTRLAHTLDEYRAELKAWADRTRAAHGMLPDHMIGEACAKAAVLFARLVAADAAGSTEALEVAHAKIARNIAPRSTAFMEVVIEEAAKMAYGGNDALELLRFKPRKGGAVSVFASRTYIGSAMHRRIVGFAKAVGNIRANMPDPFAKPARH